MKTLKDFTDFFFFKLAVFVVVKAIGPKRSIPIRGDSFTAAVIVSGHKQEEVYGFQLTFLSEMA